MESKRLKLELSVFKYWGKEEIIGCKSVQMEILLSTLGFASLYSDHECDTYQVIQRAKA